jgi:hypothetical protein
MKRADVFDLTGPRGVVFPLKRRLTMPEIELNCQNLPWWWSSITMPRAKT